MEDGNSRIKCRTEDNQRIPVLYFKQTLLSHWGTDAVLSTFQFWFVPKKGPTDQPETSTEQYQCTSVKGSVFHEFFLRNACSRLDFCNVLACTIRKKERKKGRILAQTVIELCSNHVGKYKLYNSKAMQVPLIFSYFSFCLQEVLTSTKRMANGKALPASFFWCAQTVQLSTSFARPTRRGQNLPMLSMNYPPLPSGPSEPVMLLFPNLRRL